ncbi:MAG: nitrous oxide reductase accessory protein NosL [Gammaproteobacteria bacterium]|nr:nitrous oxide reductase accessory protein NosL [Gammaproteobacteria bacterium]
MFLLCVVFLPLLTGGCDKAESPTVKQPPVAIVSGDECHVCGMTISRFPGPKGEAYVRGATKPFKFCSTRDLFSWFLQPENKVSATSIYVQDMGATDWAHPGDSTFIDARSAWYVANQSLQGAMGPTLASFASKADAEKFIKKNGGQLLRFQDVTLELVATLHEDNGPRQHTNH